MIEAELAFTQCLDDLMQVNHHCYHYYQYQLLMFHYQIQDSFIHLFICTVIKATCTAKMCMQDKAAYATLTVALYNWAIKHYYTPRTH